MRGQQFGHYRIDRLIGQGGMGAVYEASDVRTNQKAAVKIMRPNLAEQERFRQRFQQEAQLAARLKHPNVVEVYDFGQQGRMLYLAMELVPFSLRSYLRHLYREGKIIDLNEALELGRQVAEALAYAHQQNMVHRDVKPDNILLRPSSSAGKYTAFRALLTDFGLARLIEGSTQSMHHPPAGTYAYMSPEQLQGKPAKQASDIYSLGVMLYELAAGRLPFHPEPKTLAEAARAHMEQTPPRPSTINPSIPAEVEQLIMKCL